MIKSEMVHTEKGTGMCVEIKGSKNEVKRDLMAIGSGLNSLQIKEEDKYVLKEAFLKGMCMNIDEAEKAAQKVYKDEIASFLKDPSCLEDFIKWLKKEQR